ncbi:MAG: GxGYxYP family putative glycoside hydrolase, partial [Limnochordia bacterium]|nr:GxGYxYP family putative glycoside hydrolase [Limnochordia bacterium]
LWIDLVGAHPQAPPGLKISLNGEQLGVVLPEPGNNAPVYVDPAGGKEEIIAIVLPSDKLKTTGNQLTIKTQGGSWVVYDGIKMVSFRGNVPEGFLPVEEDPWAGITPVIKPGMVVVTPAPTTMGEQAMLVSLQGLVNQRVGRLYLGAVTDHWFQQAVPLNQMPVQVKSPLKVLEAFKQEVQGLVIYDPALIDTVNVAFTLAGLNQAIVVSPDLAQELLARWDDLTIVADLQDRWSTRLEAYTWAYAELWPKCNQGFILNNNPGMIHMQDLQVANRGFGVYLDAGIPEERVLLEEIYRQMNALGTVFGWPGGDADAAIDLASQYGHSYVVTDWCDNLSVLGKGIPPVLKQAEPTMSSGDAKLYVTFILDHAGVFHYNQFHMLDLWNDGARGQVPVGWTVHPRLVDLASGIIDYYFKTATPNDYFLAPINPSGFVHLEAVPDSKAYGTYLQGLLKKAGIKLAWLDSRENAEFDKLSGEVVSALLDVATYGGLDAVFFGRSTSTNCKAVVLGDVTVFPVMYMHGGESAKDLAYRTHQSGAANDGFVVVGIDSWGAGPSYVAEVVNALEDMGDVMVLRPDAWVSLYTDMLR